MNTKHKVMITMALILVLTGASIFSIVAEKLPQNRKIIVTRAGTTIMGQTINLQGYIEPKAKQEIVLSPNQKVAEVFVQEGQEVKAGDLLFRLDDSDTAYRLKSEQMNLKSAQTELNNVLKSEAKDKKDLAFAITQAEIQFNNSMDDFADAKQKHEDNLKLFSEGFISKEELDNSSRSLSKLNNSMKLQEVQLEKAKEALSSYGDQRQQQIEKLRSNIELIKMSIDSLNSKIDISTKALINGKVINCKLQNDQYPPMDNTKVEIYDLSQYVINTYVKQNEAIQLVLGQKATITPVGLEQNTFLGTIVDIDETATIPQGGSKVPMVKIRIAIDEPYKNVMAGFEVEIKIDLNMRTNVLAVNFQGVVEDQQGNKFIYFFKDNKAERKLIKTGMVDGFMIEVVEGLIPGDQYILNPPERVQKEDSFKLWSWGYELK